ncbi:hypothetical protein Q8A73_000190 [Channa argus]|nr:hypothetical protein Q8A73_000190 [Channa argus]
MTRYLSNGPRCISIHISHLAAAVKVANERHHGREGRMDRSREAPGPGGRDVRRLKTPPEDISSSVHPSLPMQLQDS